MKVSINAGGREVSLETADTNVTPEGVAKLVMEMWESTRGARDRPGGVGFASVDGERPPVSAS